MRQSSGNHMFAHVGLICANEISARIFFLAARVNQLGDIAQVTVEILRKRCMPSTEQQQHPTAIISIGRCLHTLKATGTETTWFLPVAMTMYVCNACVVAYRCEFFEGGLWVWHWF